MIMDLDLFNLNYMYMIFRNVGLNESYLTFIIEIITVRNKV